MRARRAAAATALLALAAVLPAGPARAWQPVDPAEPSWGGTVPYSVNERGSEDLGGFAATEAIVRDGFEQWTRVACTDLATRYEGASSSMPLSGGTNVIGWVESGWSEDPLAIGVTAPRWRSGEIVEASMAMNGEDYTFTTEPGTGSRVNTYSIVLHEAGHWLGIGHSSDPDATMFTHYGGGVRSLNADDGEAICSLYPGSTGGPTGCPAGGCPAGEQCIGGTCVPAEAGAGAGGLCDPCTTDADCAGDGGCVQYGEGSYCGPTCSNDAECDGGTCETLSDDSRRCVRRNDSGVPDCSGYTGGGDGTGSGTGDGGPTGAALGEPCVTDDDCASDLCAVDDRTEASFCTTACNDGACPEGFGCRDPRGVALCAPIAGASGSFGTASSQSGVTGGCRATGTGTSAPAFATVVVVLGLAVARRRAPRGVHRR